MVFHLESLCFFLPVFHNIYICYFRNENEKPLNKKELDETAQNLSDIGLDFTDESEGEDEVIETNTYNSTSELSGDEDSENILELHTEQENEHFYIAKDDDNIWRNSPVCMYSKTKSKNIIRVVPSSKGARKNISDQPESFFTFITKNMIDNIVASTNIYIDDKKINCCIQEI